MSSAEAEYVATGCCASILWMKSQLSDYDIHYKMVPIFCGNTNAIAISNNPVLHSRTKHIDIRYNFIRDHILKGDIELHFSPTEYQLADIYTKPLNEPTFTILKAELVSNGQRPLTLDFKIFCSSTGLDYNNGKYVDHPTPEVVKKELEKIAINPSYLDKTPVLKNSFPVAWRILFTFVIQDPSKVTDIELTAHMIALNNRRDSLSPPLLVAKPKKGKSQTTKESPPNPTEGSEQSHSVSSGTVPDPQDLERNIQLASTGLPSTLNEGTHPSKPLPEGTATYPKDSGGNKQPLDRDITSTTSNEGMAKTTPRPDGSLGDKDSGGNIPPADMEPIHTHVANLSGTGAKYQEDQTQSSRLSDEEVLAAGDDMDEDPQDDKEVRTPSPKQDQLEPSYVNDQASVDQYYDENIAHRDQTDKLMEASMSSLDKSSTTISDLYKGLNVITQLLKDISNAVKDDPYTNQKINETTETFARISSNVTKVLSLVKGFNFSALLSIVKSIQDHGFKQEEASAAWMKTSTNMSWNLGSRITGVDKGKGIATESDDDLLKKLVKASSIIRPDPDEPVGKAKEEARLLAMTKPKVIKVVQEEAEKIGLDPKAIKGAKAGEMFKNAQHAKHVVLKRQHTEKVRKSLKLRKHKGIDGRNFEVCEPFLFGAFGISELDELREIIPKKKNAVKHVELEPETRIPGLECNRALPENVPFVNNMVIKEPKYVIFFTNKFGDQAFQRWSDVDKVGMEALVSYLVAASMVKCPKNARFNIKLTKLIAEQLDQEKLKSKKVKLEALRYNMD
ncbi:hypothetical protein Tco_1202640 [Tanacetum coccineum]